MQALRTATLTHLEHEEGVLEVFYLEHEDHPEIVAMARAYRKRTLSFAGRFFAWVTDGATPEERAALSVPAPVFAVVNGLFGRGYRRDVAPVWR